MKVTSKLGIGTTLRVEFHVGELIKMAAQKKKELADANLSVAEHTQADIALLAFNAEIHRLLTKEGFGDPGFIVELVEAEVEAALAADKAIRIKIAELRKNKLAYFSSTAMRFHPSTSEPSTQFPNMSSDAD